MVTWQSYRPGFRLPGFRLPARRAGGDHAEGHQPVGHESPHPRHVTARPADHRGGVLTGGFRHRGQVLTPPRQQLIGVTFGTVQQRPLSLRLRAPGRVQVDESQLAEVSLKYEAYVEELFVSQTGQSVKRGDPLLTL